MLVMMLAETAGIYVPVRYKRYFTLDLFGEVPNCRR